MKLFEVKAGTRVRLTSRTVRYLVQTDISITVAVNATIEGTTTDQFLELGGHNRRLIIDLNIDFWKGLGVWQRDCECEVIT